MFFKSQGRRNFDNCLLKEPQFTRPPANSSQSSELYGARLKCPKVTAEQGISSGNYLTQRSAVRNLAKIAAATVCNSCPFAGMTPIELADYRAAEARAEAARLDAETELTKSQARQAEVMADIAGRVATEQSGLPPQQLPPAQ